LDGVVQSPLGLPTDAARVPYRETEHLRSRLENVADHPTCAIEIAFYAKSARQLIFAHPGQSTLLQTYPLMV
jgi:hypothetical protein